MFAKDRLFARLNLGGDELAVYEHMHSALGEKIAAPSLVIHLPASTDVLMNRIATRDRSYERTMSRQYIDELRLAYERFFADYDQAPVLNMDTSDLDFVVNLDNRRTIVGLVRNALQHGPTQQPLPQMEPTWPKPAGRTSLRKADVGRRFRNAVRQRVDAGAGSLPNVYLNYLGLAAEVGEMGSELKRLWIASGPDWSHFVNAGSAAGGSCRLAQRAVQRAGQPVTHCKRCQNRSGRGLH